MYLSAWIHNVEQKIIMEVKHVMFLIYLLAPIFFQVIDHPMVLPLIEYFMGDHIILGGLSARIVRLEDPVQYLHGDIPQFLLKKSAEFPVMMNTV